MNRHHVAWLGASVIFAGMLLAYLLVRTGLNGAGLAHLIFGVRADIIGEIAAMLAVNAFIAGEKWRLVDREIRGHLDGCMPRSAYFAWTAIGTGLGQITPGLSLVLCRSVASHLYGGNFLVRGGAASLFEQLFDLVVAGMLGFATVIAVMTLGRATTWLSCAFLFAIVGLGLSGTALPLFAVACGLLARVAPKSSASGWLLRLSGSPLLAAGLARRLYVLSLLRFVILVGIAAATRQSLQADPAIWQLAAALPFGILATALAITPGGLGVNEWTMSSILFALGASFQTSAQWAIMNRVLVVMGGAVCGAIGVLVVVLARRSRASVSCYRRAR